MLAANSVLYIPMSLRFASLNSGSNGNCYFVGDEHDAILVDAGISCREIETRISRLCLDIRSLRAVIISHEHADHIRGLEVLSRKHNLPVFITAATLKNSQLRLDPSLVRNFLHDEPILFNNLAVVPFRKHHDAADPFSFTVEKKGEVVGVFTDIGHACENVMHHFSRCHAVFLESNYDEQMLEQGGYPYPLKKRIRSQVGHLSNDQAVALFLSHRTPKLEHLILSHLSMNNNKPEIVDQLFSEHAGNTRITVASRFEESVLFKLHGAQSAVKTNPLDNKRKKKFTAARGPEQLRLF